MPEKQHPAILAPINTTENGDCSDHLIVSGNLLDTSSKFFTGEDKATVARLPFLLTEDKKYGDDEPFRTYKGMKYQGGISDHLPVYADFELILY